MAIFKEFRQSDIKTSRSFLNQLVDVIQEDISGTVTRRKQQVFVTGGVGPGVTSSLVQTVYDQDFTLQTANPVMDLTMGLFVSSSTVQGVKTGEDSAGKYLFPSTSLMMREKIDIYRQFAQTLLGDADSQFIAPLNSTDSSDQIDEAFFIAFKRLFHRDQIKRETFAMKFYQTASSYGDGANDGLLQNKNLSVTTVTGSAIFTDVGSSANKEVTFGGQVSNIVDSSDTTRTVGLMFNDRGIAVFDMAKILSGGQPVSGVIDGMSPGPDADAVAGQTHIGRENDQTFIPHFLSSASIDNIIDHIAQSRFQSGSQTAITFQNVTNINSTLFFCRATADEFNYSSNPTFVDSDNRISVIDQGQEDTQRTFTFVTSVGLYDANNNLLAVAKLSRPVEKNDERDLTYRVRLDF